MKYLTFALLGIFLSIGSFAVAAPNSTPTYQFLDYEFQQEKMCLTQDSVVAVSSFKNQDFITAYTFNGEKLWDASFHAKIVSWKIVSDYVFVFSKHRDGTKTYITCLDRHTGSVIWQRP